jgi:hypothetical protein
MIRKYRRSELLSSIYEADIINNDVKKMLLGMEGEITELRSAISWIYKKAKEAINPTYKGSAVNHEGMALFFIMEFIKSMERRTDA